MRPRWWIAGYLVAMAAVLLAPFASPDPDGLERVAIDSGYIEQADEPRYSVIADYLFPGVEHELLATLLAGWAGVTMIFIVVSGAAYVVSRMNASNAGSRGGASSSST